MDQATELMQRVFVFTTAFSEFIEKIPNTIKHLTESNAGDSAESSTSNLLVKSLQFECNNLLDMHQLFVKNTFEGALKEISNLKAVNAKILEKIKASQVHDVKNTQDAFMQTEDVIPSHHSLQNNSLFESSSTCLSSTHLEINTSSFNTTLNSSSSKSTSKVIIYNVPPMFGIQEIIEEINEIDNSSIKVIKSFNNKNSENANHVLELSTDVANFLCKRKFIKIKEKRFTVKRFISIKRCFKCQSLRHFCAKKCKNDFVCVWCGQHHEPGFCDKPAKCINCTVNNNKGHNFNTNHPAFSRTCESVKLFKMKLRIRLNSRIT